MKRKAYFQIKITFKFYFKVDLCFDTNDILELALPTSQFFPTIFFPCQGSPRCLASLYYSTYY